MKTYRKHTSWPTVVAGAALIAATVAVGTVDFDSATQGEKIVDYLSSIANHEQAGSAWLHAELESLTRFGNMQASSSSGNGLSEQEASDAAVKAISRGKSTSVHGNRWLD